MRTNDDSARGVVRHPLRGGRRVLVPGLVGWVVATLPLFEPPAGAAESVEATSVHLKLVDEVDVPARQAGVLEAVEVREGQVVKRGELLARIDDAEMRLKVRQAELDLVIAEKEAEDESALRAAREALRVAVSDLTHAQEAQKRIPDLLSATEMDHLELARVRADSALLKAKTDLAVAQATAQLSRKDLEFAQLKLERHRLHSPLDGMVVQMHRQAGEWVQAGDEVLRVVGLDPLRAEGFVRLTDIDSELVGAKVVVTADAPGAPGSRFEGEVVFVHPMIDPLNRQVRVWANVRNSELKLRPGMPVRMEILVNGSAESRE